MAQANELPPINPEARIYRWKAKASIFWLIVNCLLWAFFVTLIMLCLLFLGGKYLPLTPPNTAVYKVLLPLGFILLFWGFFRYEFRKLNSMVIMIDDQSRRITICKKGKTTDIYFDSVEKLHFGKVQGAGNMMVSLQFLIKTGEKFSVDDLEWFDYDALYSDLCRTLNLSLADQYPTFRKAGEKIKKLFFK